MHSPRSLMAGAALFSAAVVSTAALAQTPPKPLPPAPPEVMEPPNENQAPPKDPSTDDEKPKEPLTKKLREGEGVLEPPRSVDPGIEKQPPEDFQGKTPVIPPPSDQNTRPPDPNTQPK